MAIFVLALSRMEKFLTTLYFFVMQPIGRINDRGMQKESHFGVQEINANGMDQVFGHNRSHLDRDGLPIKASTINSPFPRDKY